jgi:hypothetical protein
MCVLYRVDYGNMKNKTFGPELFHFFRDRIEKPNIDILPIVQLFLKWPLTRV